MAFIQQRRASTSSDPGALPHSLAANDAVMLVHAQDKKVRDARICFEQIVPELREMTSISAGTHAYLRKSRKL